MDVKGATVAVTGASGMLGVYICRELLARGAKVRGVVRNPQKAAFLGDEGVTFAVADLADRAALTEAFRGADAVVSNAALFALTKRTWAEYLAANSAGTENVFHAVRDAGVKRVIHISTYGVYRFRFNRARRETDAMLRGDTPEMGPMRMYRASKSASEKIARDLAQQFDIRLTVLRPTGIYGARDLNSMATMRPFMRLPILLAPTFVNPMGHAGDVSHAVANALERPVSIGQIYNVGGHNVTFFGFYRAWKRAAKRGPWLVLPLPLPLGYYVDNSKAETELDFKNRPLIEGLNEVFREDPSVAGLKQPPPPITGA